MEPDHIMASSSSQDIMPDLQPQPVLAQSKIEATHPVPTRHPRASKSKKQVTQKDFSQRQHLIMRTLEPKDEQRVPIWPNPQVPNMKNQACMSPANQKQQLASSKPNLANKSVISQSAQNFYLQDPISSKPAVADRNRSQVPHTFGGQKFSKTTASIATSLSQKNRLQKPKIPKYSSNERVVRNKYNALSKNRDYSLVNLKQLNVQFLTRYQGPSSKTVRNSDMVQQCVQYDQRAINTMTDEYGFRQDMVSPCNNSKNKMSSCKYMASDFAENNETITSNLSPEMMKMMNQSGKPREKHLVSRAIQKKASARNLLPNTHDTENSLQNFKIKNQQIHENLLSNSPYQISTQKKAKLQPSIRDQNQARKINNNSSQNDYRKKLAQRPTTCKSSSTLVQFQQARAVTQTKLGADSSFASKVREGMDRPFKTSQQQNRYKDLGAGNMLLADRTIDNIDVSVNGDVLKIQQQLRNGNSSADNKNSRITRDGRPRQFSRGAQMDLSQLYGYTDNRKNFTTLENATMGKVTGNVSIDSRNKAKKPVTNTYGTKLMTSLNTKSQSQESTKRTLPPGSRDSKLYMQNLIKAQENGRLFAQEILKMPTQIHVNQKKVLTSKVSRNQVVQLHQNNTQPHSRLDNAANGLTWYKYQENLLNEDKNQAAHISSGQMTSIKNIISKQVQDKIQISKTLNNSRMKYGTIEERLFLNGTLSPDKKWNGGPPILKQLKASDQFSLQVLRKQANNTKQKQDQLSKKLSESLGQKLKNSCITRQQSQDYLEKRSQANRNMKKIDKLQNTMTREMGTRVQTTKSDAKQETRQASTSDKGKKQNKIIIKSQTEIQQKKNQKMNLQSKQKNQQINAKVKESEYSPVKKVNPGVQIAKTDFETFGKRNDKDGDCAGLSTQQSPQPILKGSSPFLAQLNPTDQHLEQNELINCSEQPKQMENKKRLSNKIQQKQLIHQQQILFHGGSFGVDNCEVVPTDNAEQTINIQIDMSSKDEKEMKSSIKDDSKNNEEPRSSLIVEKSGPTPDQNAPKAQEEKTTGKTQEKPQQKLNVKAIEESSSSSGDSSSSSDGESTSNNITSAEKSKSISKSNSKSKCASPEKKMKKMSQNVSSEKKKEIILHKPHTYLRRAQVDFQQQMRNHERSIFENEMKEVEKTLELYHDHMKENKEKYEEYTKPDPEEQEDETQNLDGRKNSKSAMLLSFIDTSINQLKKEYRSNKISPDLTPKSSITAKTQSDNTKKSKHETKSKSRENGTKSRSKSKSKDREREEMKSPFRQTPQTEKKKDSALSNEHKDGTAVVKSDVNESDDAEAEADQDDDDTKVKHPSPSSTPLIMLRSSTQRERTTEVDHSNKEPLQTLKAFFEEDEQSSIKPNDSSMDVAQVVSPKNEVCTSKMSNISQLREHRNTNVAKSSQEDTELEQYIESKHSSITQEQMKSKLKLLSPTQQYPFFIKKPKQARTPSPLQREGLQCIDDAQEYYESTLQLYDKMKRLTFIIKSKNDITVGMVEKMLKSTVVLINDFLKITGLTEEKIAQLEKTYENLTKAAINKYRSLIVKSIFKTYLSFKSVEKIVTKLVTRRKELQDIGRDNLETKDLVEFIDWRNENLEAITKKSEQITHLLHEICNLNHLFIWTQKNNNNQDEIFKLAQSMQNKNSNSLSKTFSSKTAIQYNPFQNLYDESSSEKVEVDMESANENDEQDVTGTDSEIDRYYNNRDNTSSCSLESQQENAYFSKNDNSGSQGGDGDQDDDADEADNEDEYGSKEENQGRDGDDDPDDDDDVGKVGSDQSLESDDLADILDKQIQIGLKNRDELKAQEQQKRAKAQKKFENTIKKGFLGTFQ